MKKVLIVVLAIAALAFVYWTISPLFINNEANDELPTSTTMPATKPDSETANNADTETTSKTQADVANQTSELTSVPTPPPERISPIQDTKGHPATGNVRIITTPDEQIIRYEDYNGTNGPDLKIYLSNDLDASDITDLGPARANKGNINYSVPLDVDIDDYRYILTWCEAFGVLFDYAEIN